MFTDKAQAIVDLAKDYAFSTGCSELKLPANLASRLRMVMRNCKLYAFQFVK